MLCYIILYYIIFLYYIILYYIILYYIILYYIILYYIILYYIINTISVFILILIASRLVKIFLALYRAVVETVLFTEPNESNSFPQPPLSDIVS